MKDTFAELGLGTELLTELTSLGYEEPTPIQRAAIPPILSGKDILGQAATGTGKTAAFALPILERIGRLPVRPFQPHGLVLVPTRELAVQVAEAFHRYGRTMHISVVPIYGGQEFYRQITALRRGVHVVIATPGRALDHMRRETLDLSETAIVALDEADEMLDMGFAEDIELILESTPETRQTALFSATLPPRIASIAERHLRDPARILIPRDKATKGSLPSVRQTAYIVPRAHKITALGRVLDLESPTLALIFCRTRLEVDELAERLVGRGYRVEALHGGMSQSERDRVMKKARAQQVDLLVATDVAARGIDIDHLTHVVNFDVPSSPEAYVHRIGRTGRAGREGVAITFAEPREHRLLRNIEWATKQKVAISTVPTHLDVKARRLDLTKAAIREAILAGELDSFRVVVETLAAEFDPMEVAAAATRLAHEATAGDAANEDDVHIPVIESFSRPERPSRSNGPGGYDQRGGGYGGRGGQGGYGNQNFRGGPPRREFQPQGPRSDARRDETGDAGDLVRVYIAAGRESNVRPADLVGAIANESGIDARGIGAIEIADHFSLVELRERDVDRVIDALKNATIKGRKVTIRRDDGIQRDRSAAPRPAAAKAGGSKPPFAKASSKSDDESDPPSSPASGPASSSGKFAPAFPGKYAGKHADKPSGTFAGKFSGKFAGKPGSKPGMKPGSKPGMKPGMKPGTKPGPKAPKAKGS